MEEKKYTWREWKQRGFAVVKGEKSCGRDEYGSCVFSESQVTDTRMTPDEAEWYGCDYQHY